MRLSKNAMTYGRLLAILGLLAAVFCATLVPAAQNPFVSGSKKETVAEKPSRGGYPQFLHPVLSKITAWQRSLRKQLTHYGKAIREQSYGQAFWYFLLFSFVYGVIHALGPGHGKTIVTSYFLSRPGKYLHGMLMGHVLTFVHVFSAVCAILVVHFVLEAGGLKSFETIGSNLERISYSLLIVLGLLLLGRYLYDLRHGHFHGGEHALSDEHNFRHILLTALVTGLVPCPGAALILIFAVSQHILPAGLLAMLCVAFGMGLTTSLFALLAIGSRSSLLRLMKRHEKMFAASHALLSIGGAVIITCIGSLLLIA